MNTLTEDPKRCNHPLELVELYRTKATQTSGGGYVHDAYVKCHKCGSEFHICSDFGSAKWDDHGGVNAPILKTARM